MGQDGIQNHAHDEAFGRTVVNGARLAFGPAPSGWPPVLFRAPAPEARVSDEVVLPFDGWTEWLGSLPAEAPVQPTWSPTASRSRRGMDYRLFPLPDLDLDDGRRQFCSSTSSAGDGYEPS